MMAAGREDPPKKAATEEEDEDNVPLALSRSKLAKKSALSLKKEAKEDDEDGKPLPRSKTFKKMAGATNANGPAKVKKEEEGDWLPSKKEMAGKKKEDGKGSAMRAMVKKEEPNGAVVSEEEEDEDDKKDTRKQKKKMIKKKMVERKKVMKKVGKITTEETGKKREKKVYDLPGQKHDPPEERDPLRIFYETLYQQLPNSEMAQFWMMEYGLLPSEVADKIYQKKLSKNQQQKLTSPVKAFSTKKTTVSVKTVTQVSARETVLKMPAKRKIGCTSSDDDDGFISLKKKLKKQKV